MNFDLSGPEFEIWLRAASRTALIVVFVGLLSIPVSFLAAFVSRRINSNSVRFLASLLSCGVMLPLYIVAGGWNAGFGDLGWWTLTQVEAVKFPLKGIFAVVLIHSSYLIPILFLLFRIALSRTALNVESLALQELSVTQQLRSVVLPLAMPWIALSMLIVIATTSNEMLVTNLYRVPTLAEQVYLDYSGGNIRVLGILNCVVPPLAVALSVPFVANSIARQSRFSSSSAPDLGCRNTASGMPVAYQSRFLAILFFVLLVCCVQALPLTSLIAKAGWISSQEVNAIQSSWSLQQFAETIATTPSLFQSEASWSLQLAILSSTVWILVALAIHEISSRSKVATWSTFVVCSLLMSLPGPIVGWSIILLMNRSEPAILGYLFDHTLVPVVLALGFRQLPIAVFGVFVVFSSIDRRWLEVASLDGVGRFRQFALKLRHCAFALFGIWLLLAAQSVAELSTIILVLPPGVTTLSMRIFEMLHYGVRYQESGVCLYLAALAFVISWLLNRLLASRSS